MGRKPKFTEAALVTGIEQYASVYKGPIKIAEFVRWANIHIPELKGVQYYHLTRDLKARADYGYTACDRIEEINRARKIADIAETNVILSGDDDLFLSLTSTEQRAILAETRNIFRRLQSENITLTVQKNNLSHKWEFSQQQLTELQKRLETSENMVTTTQRELAKTKTSLDAVVNTANRDLNIAALASIGIVDNKLDLTAFYQSQILTAPDVNPPQDTAGMDKDTGPAFSDMLGDIDFGDDDSDT